MELPHLGQHCSEEFCRQLDFLPIKCDGCKKIFCGDHYSYSGHNCPVAYKKNVQVPVCPLCNAPVPGRLDELPDIRVSRHIDDDCKSDTAKDRRKKVYSNKCSHKGCKQKEMIPLLCDKCQLNYCLKHRHPQDHACTDIAKPSLGKSGQAAVSRNQSNPASSVNKSHTPFSTSVSNAASAVGNGIGRAFGFRSAALQGNMSEEEALRIALQSSLEVSGNSQSQVPNHSAVAALSQEEEDFMLAKALSESEQDAQASASARGRRSQSHCEVC